MLQKDLAFEWLREHVRGLSSIRMEIPLRPRAGWETPVMPVRVVDLEDDGCVASLADREPGRPVSVRYVLETGVNEACRIQQLLAEDARAGKLPIPWLSFDDHGTAITSWDLPFETTRTLCGLHKGDPRADAVLWATSCDWKPLFECCPANLLVDAVPSIARDPDPERLPFDRPAWERPLHSYVYGIGGLPPAGALERALVGWGEWGDFPSYDEWHGDIGASLWSVTHVMTLHAPKPPEYRSIWYTPVVAAPVLLLNALGVYAMVRRAYAGYAFRADCHLETEAEAPPVVELCFEYAIDSLRVRLDIERARNWVLAAIEAFREMGGNWTAGELRIRRGLATA